MINSYFILFSLLSTLSILQFDKEVKKYKLLFFLFSAIVLIVFAGLRQLGVGKDDYSYYQMFIYDAPNIYDWLFGNYSYDIHELYMEPGYVFINSFVKIFTSKYEVFFLSIAFISVGIASYNYYKYSQYVFLTLLLFFVHTYLYRDMNQIRAGISASIGLLLIAQIYNKEHLKIIFTIFVASLFHLASLSFIIAYVLGFITWTKKKIVFLYLISLTIGSIGLSKMIVLMLPNVNFLTMKIINYANSQKYSEAISLFDITNIKNSIILFFVVLFWNKLKSKVPYFNTIILFFILSTCWRIAFSDLGILASRVSTFFGIVEVILLPYFIYVFRQKVFIAFLIILYAMAVLYLNITVKEIITNYHISIF